MTSIDRLYAGLFKALLTEEALDKAGRRSNSELGIEYDGIRNLAGADSLDELHVANATLMSAVYLTIAAFENSVRELISKTLLEEVGADWWEKCVPNSARKAAEKRKDEEEKVKWHTQRGDDLIQFTMLPNLLAVIRNNFEHFEASINDIEWASSIFDTVERSRNVIMHSGSLSKRDISRLGSSIRDWTSQVST
ncbi:Swt1 family HEPN domain-containing protein [Roseobacter sp. A03A-229]